MTGAVEVLPEAAMFALFEAVGLQGKTVVVRKEMLGGRSANALRTTFYRRREKYRDMPGALNTTLRLLANGDVEFYSLADAGSVIGLALMEAGVSLEEQNRAAERALLGNSGGGNGNGNQDSYSPVVRPVQEMQEGDNMDFYNSLLGGGKDDGE